MLEFHPSLACISRLPDALKHAIEELNYFKSTTTIIERLNLEIQFMSQALESLQNLNPPGYSFASNIQKDIFNGTFVEDPLIMSDFIDYTVRQLEETAKNKTKKEQQELIIGSITKTVEVFTF